MSAKSVHGIRAVAGGRRVQALPNAIWRHSRVSLCATSRAEFRIVSTRRACTTREFTKITKVPEVTHEFFGLSCSLRACRLPVGGSNRVKPRRGESRTGSKRVQVGRSAEGRESLGGGLGSFGAFGQFQGLPSATRRYGRMQFCATSRSSRVQARPTEFGRESEWVQVSPSWSDPGETRCAPKESIGFGAFRSAFTSLWRVLGAEIFRPALCARDVVWGRAAALPYQSGRCQGRAFIRFACGGGFAMMSIERGYL